MRGASLLLLGLVACRPSAAPPPSTPPAPAVDQKAIDALEEQLGGRFQKVRIGLGKPPLSLVVTSTTSLRPDLLRYDVELRGPSERLPEVAKALELAALPSTLLGAEDRGGLFRVAFSTYASPRQVSAAPSERLRALQGFLHLTEASLPWTRPLRTAADARCFGALRPAGAKALRLELPTACRTGIERTLAASLAEGASLHVEDGALVLRFPDHVER